MTSFLLLSVLSVSVLDNKPIYENPLAFVRSPESSVFVKSSVYRGARLEYLEATIGRSVPLFKVDVASLEFQLGIEGAAWSILGYYEGSFPLITQDFLIAAPLMFRSGSFSGALKFNHISAHMGDGIDLLWERSLTPEEKQQIEMIEDQAEVSVVPAIKNYSRDFLSFEMAQDSRLGSISLTSYFHVGYIHKVFPKRLERWFAARGSLLKHSSGLFISDDLRYNQDTDTLDFSFQTGWIVTGDLAETRFCFVGYHGSDRRGQFLGRKLSEFGFGISIR